MRGKLSGFYRIAAERRITPAHAGKTLLQVFLYLLFEDHPRACGENSYSIVIMLSL